MSKGTMTLLAALAAGILVAGAGCRGEGSSDYDWSADGDTEGDAGGDADGDGDGDGDADGDADADGDRDGDADGDGGSVSCTACEPDEACLVVNVSRAADDSMLPWVVWPTEADGVGTLVVTAVDSSNAAVAAAEAPDADMNAEDAMVVVELCSGTSATQVVVFLDDDEDAAAGTIWSADYIDACLASPRRVDISPVAGEELTVEAVLNNSCD